MSSEGFSGPGPEQPAFGPAGPVGPPGPNPQSGPAGPDPQFSPPGQGPQFAPPWPDPASGQPGPFAQAGPSGQPGQYTLYGRSGQPGPFGGVPQWGFPQPGFQPRTNPVAIAALVCGLVQFLLGLLILGNILLAIPAVVLGAIGLRQTAVRGERGRGLAIAGLILGILGIVYFSLVLVVILVGVSRH
jgi:Domain of unknown function (DUF4190)